jgi:hypothetical protein
MTDETPTALRPALPELPELAAAKDSHLQDLSDARGGTRTPDTRIMIPLL